MTKKTAILIFFIVILAFLPRAIEVLSGNYLFGFDQGIFYNDVREIFVDHKIPLIGAEVGGIGGFFQGPGWTYLLTLPYILFNGDPYGGMILMLVMGIASVLLSILLFKKSIGIPAAMLTGLFMALSPGIISQSRFIWPPFVITPLTVLFLYCVYNLKKKPTVLIPSAFGIIGLMAHFEIATGITLCVATIASLLLIYRKELLKIKVILLSVLALIVTQGTLLVFDLRHDFISSKGILNLFLHNKEKVEPYNFQNHIDIFKDAFLSISFNFPLILITVLLAGYGAYKFLRDKKHTLEQKQFLMFLMVTSIALFIVFLPMKMTLWAWWVLEVPVFLCFIYGLTFSYLFKIGRMKYIVALLIVIYALFYVKQTVSWYSYDFTDYGGIAKIKGKIDAIDYIYKDANGKKFNLLVFTPPVYTHAYDYLLKWHGEKIYGYVPKTDKDGVFYLLIEKDSEKPWSYEGWIKTVIKVGKVEKKITLPSGFIIEKRRL